MAKVAKRYLEVDPWIIQEKGFHPERSLVSESLFSLANEFMGVRGYFEEGYSGRTMVGSYFNSIFERFFIDHPFRHRGMAKEEQKMLNSVDWLYTRLKLEGKQLDLAECKFKDFRRSLDMREGVLKRSLIWQIDDEKKLKLNFQRFVSMADPNIGCQKITFEPINFDGEIEVTAGLDFNLHHHNTSGFISEPFESVWQSRKQGIEENMLSIMAQVPNTGHRIFSSIQLRYDQDIKPEIIKKEKFLANKFRLKLQQGNKTELERIAVNVTEKDPQIQDKEFWGSALNKAKQFTQTDYKAQYENHVNYWKETWDKLDIEIKDDPLNQQGIRFCIFHMHQSYHGYDPSLNIAAKGLSGDGYDGKAWWDSETYCLPFYLFNNPKAARNLLDYRYKTLPEACRRSKEVDGCEGARYPMSTIDGKETTFVWQHGDLEIHVSAAITYGLWHYVNITGDDQFLYDKGAEILIQVCRYYASRGDFSQKNRDYGFWNVMGADEFHMQVNNNAYTNVMAKKTFQYTLDVLKQMENRKPDLYENLIKKVNLKSREKEDWKYKAERMRTNFDEKTKLYEQHDGFFDYPHLDLDKLTEDDIPIYDNWPYLKIFRYDMLKQPDVLLLLFFFSHEYSKECKSVNYDYYEERCIHESSLSPAIHSIMAAELDKHDEAYEFFKYATRLDLDDYNRNTAIGLHVTSMAAAWMNIVYGFGGMRSDADLLSFEPSIPANWNSFRFRIIYRDSVMQVSIDKQKAEFKVIDGDDLDITFFAEKKKVNKDGIEVKMPDAKVPE